jgi:hypothetical protein
MNATITDITTRTTALGRVVEAMLTHRVGETVNFVALGMCLRSTFRLDGLLIESLGVDETTIAQVTVSANAGRYEFADRYVVLTQVDGVVLADAHELSAALADALTLLHERWTA